MLDEPVGNIQEFFSALDVGGAAEAVVVSQSILRDCYGIVLSTDCAAIIELWNSSGVVDASVVCLFGEGHVVFAEFTWSGTGILHGRFVPEGEMTLAAKKIGADYATVITEAWQKQHVSRDFSNY